MTYSPPGAGYPVPQVFSTMTPDLCNAAMAVSAGNAGSGTWPSAGAAYLYPIPALTRPRTYVRAWWVNGATVAGNVDVGVYTISGTTATRVASTGAVAQAGASVMQVVTPTAFTLAAGVQYWFAMSCSLATATVWKSAAGTVALRPAGCFQITASANPLPSTGTVAVIAQTHLPLFGFSELATL